MESSNYKNETKYLNNMQKNRFSKVKKSLLELEKDFIELKDGELKDREVNTKREREREREKSYFLRRLLCL